MSTLQSTNLKHASSATNNIILDASGNTAIQGTLQVGGLATNIYPLVSGTSQASTSGTSIDFTGIPSWVRRITVTFDSVSFNGSDGASLQLGDSGGIETSGYTGVIGVVTGTSSGTAGSWPGSGIPVIYAGTAAGDNCSGVIHLMNQSGNKWNASGIVARNGTVQIFNTQGWKTLSDTLDRIRFRVDGASSFDAGSINIMYE